MYTFSEDGEQFGYPTFNTRDEAVRGAEACGCTSFYTGRAVAVTVDDLVPNFAADRLVEDMADQAEQECGEENWPDVTPQNMADLGRRLREVVAQWIQANNLNPTFSRIVEIVQHTRELQ